MNEEPQAIAVVLAAAANAPTCAIDKIVDGTKDIINIIDKYCLFMINLHELKPHICLHTLFART